MQMAFTLGVALSAFLASGCAPEATADAASGGPSPAGADAGEGTIFHLEGRQGAPGALWVQASYKIKREEGRTSKALGIDIADAPPGESHALSLDGFAFGKLVTSKKGEAEYELAEAGGHSFPEGFQEPKDGSILRIGELAEIRLLTLHKLTDLHADIAGPGKLGGKVGYKVERLGDTVTTEFQVKVTQAGGKSVHPVRIDGVHVGDLSIDLAGKGKLLYSTLEGEPFPPDFRVPEEGSTVEIGELYEGRLRDDLGEHSQ